MAFHDVGQLKFASQYDQGVFSTVAAGGSVLAWAIWLWELDTLQGQKDSKWAEEPEGQELKSVRKLAYTTAAVEHVKAGGYHESASETCTTLATLI